MDSSAGINEFESQDCLFVLFCFALIVLSPFLFFIMLLCDSFEFMFFKTVTILISDTIFHHHRNLSLLCLTEINIKQNNK